MQQNPSLSLGAAQSASLQGKPQCWCVRGHTSPQIVHSTLNMANNKSMYEILFNKQILSKSQFTSQYIQKGQFFTAHILLHLGRQICINCMTDKLQSSIGTATYILSEMTQTVILCRYQQWQKCFFHMSLYCRPLLQAVQVLCDLHTAHCSVSDTGKAKKCIK